MDCFNRATGLAGYITEHAPEVFLTDEEKRTRLVEGDYWVINAGYKAQLPGEVLGARELAAADYPDAEHAVCAGGELHHNHPLLEGDNVIDLYAGRPASGSYSRSFITRQAAFLR